MDEGSGHAAPPSLDATGLAMLDSLVSSLEATRRGIAAFQAMEAQLMNAALALSLERVDGARGDGDLPIREVAAEIGAALRVSDRTVQRQLEQARVLIERFPATLDALTNGRISRSHVSVIVDAGDRIDERHRDAARERCVRVADLDDGMAELLLIAPAVHIHGIHDRLTQQAKAVKDADCDEPRSFDELRADLLTDLALTGEPRAHQPSELLGAVTAEVHIAVPVLTLAGASLEPAMLDGVQPVDLATALQLVGSQPGWDRVLTHPVTGAVLAVDRYRPNADLRRTIVWTSPTGRQHPDRVPARVAFLPEPEPPPF